MEAHKDNLATKSNLVTKASDIFAGISVWSLRHRWLVFSICLAILGVCMYLASSIRMDNGFETFFNEDDISYSAYLQYRDDFGSDEIAYLMYDASELEHGVFNLELMQKIEKLTHELDQDLAFVKEVKSISNAEVIIGNEDGLDIIELSDEFPETQEAMNDFAKLFMSKSMYIGGLVSEDAKFGAIQMDMLRSSIDPVEEIRLDPNGGDGLENLYPQATETQISEILSKPEYQDIKFYISGDVPLNSAFNRIAYKYMYLAFGLCFLIIAVLLLFFFKGRLIGVFGPLSVVFLAVLMTVGFISLMGWNIDMLFGMVPTLLIAVGVAHSVHIISEFRIYYARYGDRAKALRETFYLVGTPCLLTSTTTAAGFLALSVSPIKAIEHMAVYTGLAVMAAFFLSITLLTFFLSFGKQEDPAKITKNNESPVFDAVLTRIALLNIRYPKQLTVIGLSIFILISSGISRIVVDSNFLLDFDKDVPIRKATEFIDSTMGGIGSLVYLFESGEADGVKNPEFLKELEHFQQQVDEQHLVKKTYSIVDLLKDINQSFHGGDPAFYTIPEDQDLIAQYLLVYELSGGEELHNFVSADYSRAALDVRTVLANSSDVAKMKADIDALQAEKPLEHADTAFTGIGSLWIQLVDYISESQIKGVLLAFVVITIMMCFIFQNVKVGLISMIPNTAPALISVGAIGWIGVPLDYMKLMIAPIAIGIAVDDTIHLLTRFHHEFRRCGNYNEALIESMKDVGKALTITSIVLVIGFLTFCISPMDSQYWFGLLLAGTIIIALIADFFVMPSMILLIKPFGPEFEPELTSEDQAIVDSSPEKPATI